MQKWIDEQNISICFVIFEQVHALKLIAQAEELLVSKSHEGYFPESAEVLKPDCVVQKPA